MDPNTVRIYSENSEFQQIQALRENRTKRNKMEEFFVEGVRAINQAIANRWEISTFIFSRENRLSDWAEELLEKSNSTRQIEMPYNLLQKISQKENTSELIALVKDASG